MFKRLAHVCIGAINLVDSEHFYVNLLGMEKAFDFYRDNRQVGFYLRAGGTTFIEVFVESGLPKDERPLIRHFCLEVDDLEGVIAALTNKGVEVSAKKLGADGAWQAWIADPAGIRIELMQYGGSSSQFSGRRVELP